MDKDIDIWKQRNEILHKKVNRQMTDIKDLHEQKETIFDLARKFPDKTYKELEKYRDADRQEEADNIPLTESQKRQAELEPIEKGICITAEMRKDRTPLDNMKRRAQEAEGELSILKGLETNRVKEAQARSSHLQDELDRTKRENNDSFERIAELCEINESHQKLNGKLQARLTEVEEDNKKMHEHLDKSIDAVRRSGM